MSAGSRQHPFESSHMDPIRRVMVSPRLSADIRHSLLDPSFSRWGIELSLQSAYCPTLGRPHRGLHVPHEGDTVGVGAFFTPGPSVFMPGRKESPDRL